MSDFNRQPDRDFNRQPDDIRPARVINAPPRQAADVNEPTSPPSLATNPAPLPDMAPNQRPRPSSVISEPTVSRPTTAPRATLTTSGPLIAPNDIAAFIAAAVMVLLPLCGGAFWTH